MTNATAPMPGLRGMTDGELAALYDAGDAETRAAVLAWCDRQDRKARVAPALDAQKRLHSEWYDAAYADFMAAEAACVGYFVRPEYAAEITEPFRLWSGGNDEWAQSRATRELNDWWLDHPRLTFARWLKMRRDATRIAREEAAEQDTWQVPAEWEAATDGHDTERAEVDGPRPGDFRRERAAHAVRPGRDRQQHAGAEAGQVRDAGSVQRTGGAVTGAETYTPGNYAAAIVTGGKRRIIARDIPALEQAQGLLAATEEAKALEAIGQPLEWTEERPGVLRAGNSACVFLVAAAAPQGGPVVKRDAPVTPTSTAVATREPVDGNQLLTDVYTALSHFAVWPSEAALVTAVLWAAHAHAKDPKTGIPVWPYSPRLFFTSSEGGSGKSWMARLVAKMSPDGKMLNEATKAAFIRLLAKQATIVVTELDVLVGTGTRNRWFTAIANGGYEQDQTTSRVQNGKELEIPLMSPMVLDGLDSVIHSTGMELKTLMSRCIIVHVKRAPDGYRAPRFDNQARAVFARGSEKLGLWMAQQVADGIADVVPELPEGLGNRPAALWEPLITVADAAGGDWPKRARQACADIETPDLDEDGEQEADFRSALNSWAGDLDLYEDA